VQAVTPHLLLEVLTAVVFLVTMVIAPIAWFRMVRAQTRSAYLKNMAFFAAPILLTFLLADAAGIMPEPTGPPPTLPGSAEEALAGIPTGQLILLSLAAVLWVGGGNVLLYRHRRRLGKKWWQTLNPFNPPFKDFNTAEWMTLGGLVAGSFALGVLAVSYGHGAW
jgi:hypothetical protein